MIEDIKTKDFPKSSGVYLIKDVNNEIIYIGSSNDLNHRMRTHKSRISKGSNHDCQTNLYQFLQTNQFTVEFQLSDDYKQLEQQLIEQHNPKYNQLRAFTGCGARKGREAEWKKEYYQKFKKGSKQNKEHQKQYDNQLCSYNGETLTFCALSTRFRRKGVEHPKLEAKKYLNITS